MSAGTGWDKRHSLTEVRLRRIADVQKQRLRQPTTPNASSSEEGSHECPSLDREGLGVVDILDRPFVFIDILALFPRNAAFSSQPSALSNHSRLAQTPRSAVCDVPEGQVRVAGAI